MDERFLRDADDDDEGGAPAGAEVSLRIMGQDPPRCPACGNPVADRQLGPALFEATAVLSGTVDDRRYWHPVCAGLRTVGSYQHPLF